MLRVTRLSAPTKVLMVASYPNVPRVWRMARTLKMAGLQVEVLEWDRSAILPRVASIDGIKVTRLGLRGPFGSKAIFWLPFWLLYACIFALKNRYSMLQLQNFDNLFLPMLLRNFLRYKIVYDLADFYADAYIQGNGQLAKLIGRLERGMIERVDALILVSEGQLQQTGNNLPSCWNVIYNTPMNEEMQENFSAGERSSPKKNAISLFYGGVLSKDRSLPLLNLLDALRGLEGIKINVAGFGEMEETIKTRLLNNPNGDYLGALSRSQVMRYTADCDCVVIPYDKSLLNNRIGLPNKFFEGLAEAKPLLTSKQTYAGQIVEHAKCGFSTDFSVIEDITHTLEIMRDQKEELKLMGRRGRMLFDQKYNWSIMERRLMTIFDCVLKK